MGFLELHDVSLDYPAKPGEVRALENVSFSLEPHESIAIIGPSGCGKSSLLKIIQGLVTATSGTVLFEGEPVTRPARDIALILQDFGLLPWRTCAKNVELALSVRRMPRSERRQRVAEALALVELSGVARSLPRELSGGMRQRLAIARALAVDSRLLLMDEPLSALDALLRERMQERLLALWQEQGYAQIIVTHSIEEAVFLGQRIIVLSAKPGRIVDVIDNPHCGDAGFRSQPGFFEQAEHLRSLLRTDDEEDDEGSSARTEAGSSEAQAPSDSARHSGDAHA